MVRTALVLGASASAALSTAELSSPAASVAATRGAPTTSDRARASPAESPVAADDPAGAFATRRRAATAPTTSAHGASGRACSGTDAAFATTRDAVAAVIGLRGARSRCWSGCCGSNEIGEIGVRAVIRGACYG